ECLVAGSEADKLQQDHMKGVGVWEIVHVKHTGCSHTFVVKIPTILHHSFKPHLHDDFVAEGTERHGECGTRQPEDPYQKQDTEQTGGAVRHQASEPPGGGRRVAHFLPPPNLRTEINFRERSLIHIDLGCQGEQSASSRRGARYDLCYPHELLG